MRSRILIADPLPNVNQAYPKIIQEEKVRHMTTKLLDDSHRNDFAFSIRNTSKPTEKASLFLNVCNRGGHKSKSCFQVKGNTNWWLEKNIQGGSNGGCGHEFGNFSRVGGRSSQLQQQQGWAAQVHTPAVNNGASIMEVVPRFGGIAAAMTEAREGFPNFTPEQWATLASLVNSHSSNSISSS